MSSSDLNRRDFHRLSMAAMGGLMAGAAAGCGEQPAAKTPEGPKSKDDAAKTSDTAKSEPAKSGTASADASGTDVAISEKHTCHGLNTCKGLGGGKSAGKNSCAGQGECATVAEHSCGPNNECKGQGGCGKDPGNNECKGQGGCHVPLMDSAWKKVRARFEEKMKADGKKFGDDPTKKPA